MSAPNGSRGGDALVSEQAGTLAAVAHALQDAAQLTARYGSTTAARERLDMLEREQEGLNDMIAMLRTRLRQSQRATTSAEAETRRHKAALISAQANAAASGGSPSGDNSGSSGGAGNSSLFDADGFVHFLKRKFACRGDMALLLDALFEYQMQQSDAFHQQNQANERVVLLTIEEVQTSLPSSSPNASSTRSDMSYGLNVKTSSTPTNSSSMRSSTPSASNGSGSGDRKFGNIGIGVHHQYYRQSLEEEEQEIHLAAKQLLSPVTFTHVEDDDDGSKQHAGTSSSREFVPIHHHTDADSKGGPASSFMRAQTPDEAKQQLAKILPKKPKVKKTARAPSPLQHVGPYVQSAASAAAADGDEPTPKKRKTGLVEESLVIKQNLVWPAERRNITEMKHSSRFLDLSVLEALDKQTPWNEMYKRRPLYSHVVNYSELDDRAKNWFATTLKIQFVWRRELWERLHWLPMSESVCTGAAWEKYRQTRKRRAKHAVTAWRKVYAQSIQMIEAGILPDDIWCDPALWYMPANPIYWLPESHDVITELAAIDERHRVRCYHVYDLSRHPFYALGLVEKYPDKHELPSFSAISMQHPGVAEEDLANFGIRASAGPQHHPKVIITKDAGAIKRGPPVQQQPQQQEQLSTVVVPQKLKTPSVAAVVATPESAPVAGPQAPEEDEPDPLKGSPHAEESASLEQ